MSKKQAVNLMALVACFLAVASIAWACTWAMGKTVSTDPSKEFPNTVAGGTPITAFAEGANPNAAFRLSYEAGPVSDSDAMQCMVPKFISSTVNSNAGGHINPVTANLPTTKGLIHVCFYQTAGGTVLTGRGATSTIGLLYSIT